MKNEMWLRKQRFHGEPKDNVASYPRHKRKHKTFKKMDSTELLKYLNDGRRCTSIHVVSEAHQWTKKYIWKDYFLDFYPS